ncbi:hypothetical protein QE357_002477 [Siphonobacter sp. BAB-5404]|nr:hypothetical protein [Siphonobacter sp. SORGH_AS_0500]
MFFGDLLRYDQQIAMKQIIFLLAASVWMGACSSYNNVKTKRDEDADFQSYKTYNFMDVELEGAPADSSNSTALTEIKRAVAQEMNNRGYKLYGNPDLKINIGLVVQEKSQTRQTDIREAPRYIGQRRYSWKSETVEVGRYKEGTLTVDVVEAKGNKLIWQATGSTVLNKQSRQPENIDRAVAKLFEKFPQTK